MLYTKPFKELTKTSSDIAGGKGSSLGEMTQVGIPVPPGFVVLAHTFEGFLHATNLIQEVSAILNTVNHTEIHTVENASEKIQGLIKSVQTPEDIKTEILKNFDELNAEFVAVRSSATAEDGKDHAWAGQLDSYLNIRRDNVLEKVQHCWASLFTPRAIFYRFEKGLDTTKISVAVVIQKMVNSEVSGIAFSVHPVTEDRNQIIIEAGFGLGEAIVSGQITPDSYVVEKDSQNILDINISEQTRGLFREHTGGNEWIELGEQGKQQVLSKEQIIELSDLIIKIENHYGFPCDIEWAYENGGFYIVQSRPITTLRNNLAQTSEIKEILSDIKDFKYEKRVSFYRLSLISVEMPQKTFVDNPLIKSLDLDFIFNTCLVIKGETAEAWHYHSVIKTSDTQKMDKIIEFTNQANQTEMDIMFDFLKNDTEDYSPEFLIHLLDVLNEKSIVVQRPHLFFNEDCFDTDDINMLERLQKARLSTSLLVEPISRAYEKIVNIVHVKYNIPRDILDFANNQEFKQIILEKITKDELEKIRNRPYAIIVYLNKYHCIYGEDVNTLMTHLNNFEEKIENTESIAGQTAYKGKVRGEVVVINAKDYREADKILANKKGYILVTPMTRPEIMQYMKEAGAFITDEGGVTCHAAIISRELGIPCIIGTKIATKVLKNGDIVEVDADNGIVRIQN